MTGMDAGNANYAGCNNLSLGIYALCHPWHRAIPFILNIKKGKHLERMFARKECW